MRERLIAVGLLGFLLAVGTYGVAASLGISNVQMLGSGQHLITIDAQVTDVDFVLTGDPTYMDEVDVEVTGLAPGGVALGEVYTISVAVYDGTGAIISTGSSTHTVVDAEHLAAAGNGQFTERVNIGTCSVKAAVKIAVTLQQ